jgi:hypothetical protein
MRATIPVFALGLALAISAQAAPLAPNHGSNTLPADAIERVEGCRGDEPAYFDQVAHGVGNSSARRRTWIASGKSR